MFAAAGGFVLMAQWDEDTLRHWPVNLTLLLTGFGFGLALAPVNAALLASTEDSVHGVASALVVVARLVEIGRESCRERVCQYVSIWVGAGPLKKNKTQI